MTTIRYGNEVKLIIRDRMTKLRSVSHHQFAVLTQKAQNVIYSKAHDTVHIALFCGLYAVQAGFIHAVFLQMAADD